ncbi:unnamed protein product [Angiostrongylus costaricensis]|uniref:Secreted protein n=1 Tax=Angiostrongylus costaricensis TaxID=334426 RepID=A0A0R3PTQ1_ANGCS|nr:unnamed protein product [Angiostrongylus costaricensis]
MFCIVLQWDGVTSVWKWDERYDSVRSCQTNRRTAEDSCDESYKPVSKRRKGVQRKKFARQWPAATAGKHCSTTISHVNELFYSF